MPFGRKEKRKDGDAVPVSIKTVLADISAAVQNANFTLDSLSAEMYLEQGYEKKENVPDNSGETLSKDLVPIVYSVDLSPEEPAQPLRAGQAAKKLQIPATSLLHHGTMQLDDVDVTLRFAMNSRTETDLMVDLKPEMSKGAENISEMKLHFRRSEAPEGMARVETLHYQKL